MKRKLRNLFVGISAVLFISVFISGCNASDIAYYSYHSEVSAEDGDIEVIKDEVQNIEALEQREADDDFYYTYESADSSVNVQVEREEYQQDND